MPTPPDPKLTELVRELRATWPHKPFSIIADALESLRGREDLLALSVPPREAAKAPEASVHGADIESSEPLQIDGQGYWLVTISDDVGWSHGPSDPMFGTVQALPKQWRLATDADLAACLAAMPVDRRVKLLASVSPTANEVFEVWRNRATSAESALASEKAAREAAERRVAAFESFLRDHGMNITIALRFVVDRDVRVSQLEKLPELAGDAINAIRALAPFPPSAASGDGALDCHNPTPPDHPSSSWCSVCGVFSSEGAPWQLPKYSARYIAQRSASGDGGKKAAATAWCSTCALRRYGLAGARCAICGTVLLSAEIPSPIPSSSDGAPLSREAIERRIEEGAVNGEAESRISTLQAELATERAARRLAEEREKEARWAAEAWRHESNEWSDSSERNRSARETFRRERDEARARVAEIEAKQLKLTPGSTPPVHEHINQIRVLGLWGSTGWRIASYDQEAREWAEVSGYVMTAPDWWVSVSALPRPPATGGAPDGPTPGEE